MDLHQHVINMNNGIKCKLRRSGCYQLLRDDGICVTPVAEDQLEQLCSLIQNWNEFAGLVSRGDLAKLAEVHVADSLSLAAVMLRRRGAAGLYLDIGSGGGFPALVVKIVLPTLSVTLVERSEKKVAFLRKATGALGLSGVEVLHADFPQCDISPVPGVITARAVEKPDRVHRAILSLMPEGGVYLCQSGRQSSVPPDLFHVERIHDAWSASGLRRGDLYLIRRRPATARP